MARSAEPDYYEVSLPGGSVSYVRTLKAIGYEGWAAARHIGGGKWQIVAIDRDRGEIARRAVKIGGVVCRMQIIGTYQNYLKRPRTALGRWLRDHENQNLDFFSVLLIIGGPVLLIP